jgi:hypothetical protein
MVQMEHRRVVQLVVESWRKEMAVTEMLCCGYILRVVSHIIYGIPTSLDEHQAQDLVLEPCMFPYPLEH